MPADFRKRFWNTALEFCGLIAICIATPFYQLIIEHRERLSVATGEFILFALMLQLVIPLVLAFACEYWPRLGRFLRPAVYLAALAIVARLLQGQFLGEFRLIYRVAAGFSLLALIALVAIRYRATFRQWLIAAGQLSPALVAVALFFIIGAPAPAKPGIAAPPVVILLFDELSLANILKAGDIDPVRFPNFHRLSRESWWLRGATSSYVYTSQSVPSFLSGDRVGTEVRSLSNFPAGSILDRMAARGYAVRLSSVYFDCGHDAALRCSEAPPSPRAGGLTAMRFFASRLIPADVQMRLLPSTSIFAAWESARPASQFATRFEDGTLYFLHSMATHNPALIEADGTLNPLRGRLPYDLDKRGRLIPRSGLISQRLVAQMRYADRELGKIVGELKANGLWERTTFVVLADHGSCWTATCNRAYPDLTTKVEPSLLSVPLFIRSPGISARIDDRPVSLIDLEATLSPMLGLAPHGKGTNLSTGTPGRRSACVSEFAHKCRYFEVPSPLTAAIAR